MDTNIEKDSLSLYMIIMCTKKISNECTTRSLMIQQTNAIHNSPPLSTTTLNPASTNIFTLSGATLTRFSPGYVSFNTPMVNSEYGIGAPRILLDVSAMAAVESISTTDDSFGLSRVE